MLLIAICLACLIYSRSISGGFLFDDHAITDMDFQRWERAWRGDIYPDRPARFRYALHTFFVAEPRTLTHMGYGWTWRLCRLDPEGWHAVNLYIHCANIYLVYLYAKLFLPVFPAGIAALIFAVHPLQVPAVSYISGRAGIQCAFFCLAAVLCTAQTFTIGLWSIPGTALAVTLACRSKEDAPLWLLLLWGIYVASLFWRGSI